ncbi:MAG: ferredoxin [Thermoleophilia bacterium]|jgi:ferredoxin|nr:ferredoxin [Thermoleophilia bacterium]MBJ7333840.1 ferredoxin [Thermoleophilia bacterium]
MKVFITIDPDTCVGIGKCEEIAEEAVELGDDGISHVTGVAVDMDVARALCDGCPTGAISIVEEG